MAIVKSKDFTAEEITALKAVLYGCASNKRIECAEYYNRKTKEKMSFNDAMCLVSDMVEYLSEEAHSHD